MTESQTNSHPKAKTEQLNDIIGLKDSVHKSSHKQSDEDFSDEEKFTKKSSSEDSSSQSEEGKIEESSQNIVNFMIKLPKNLEKYVNYYKELSTKKQLQLSSQNSLKLLSKTIKEKNEEIPINSSSKFLIAPVNLRKIENSSEKATETTDKTLQLDENCRKELKAIVLTAEKISRNKLLNIYKVKAVISSKNYGDSKDILKVIKIVSIQKKVEKFNKTYVNLAALSIVSEEFNKSQSLRKHVNNSSEEIDKVFNLSPTLTNKFFQTRTNTNELSATNIEEIPLRNVEQSPASLAKNDTNLNFNGFVDATLNNTDKISQNQPKFFIKSFQKNKGSNSENLFLKEDTVKAHKSLKIITKIKWFIRLLFLGIFTLSLITYFLGPFSEFNTLKNKSNKIYLTKSNELKILQGYNVLMNFLFINNGYFASILSTNSSLSEYRNFQKSDFAQLYRFLIDLNQDPLMKNVLFDSSVFPLENLIYSTELLETKDLYEIQNKDLLFLYIEKLNNIYNSSDFTEISDPDIVFSRKYILPTLINLLKNIEIKLFNSINTTKIYINDFMLYILLSEVSLLLLTFVILLRYILQVTNSFQAIIEIFTYIDNADVRVIKRRFLDMLKSIAKTGKTVNEDENLTEKTDKFSRGTLTDIGKKTGVAEKSEQQFKKLKKFKVGNFLWTMKKKVLFYYFLFISVSSCLSIGFYFLVKTATGQIETLLLNGETIIGLIDGDSILLLALKENVYNSTNYQANIYEKIAEELPEYLRLQSNIYLKEIDFADFDQVSYAYFYTNPCMAYGQLNSEEMQECMNVSLGKLSFGMVSFNNYFFAKIYDFLTIKSEEKFGNLTPNEVFEFDRAIYYANQFILDILRVWSKDMTNVLDNSYNNLTIYLAFMMFTLIGAFIIAENLVVGRLNKSYKYYRGIYNNFMPTELVSKERLIKAKLVLANVLNK